jgi:hypothetical protein
MAREGKGRNEIARLLTEQGMHISEGSVGNIIRAYRAEHAGHITITTQPIPTQQSPPTTQPQQPQPDPTQDSGQLYEDSPSAINSNNMDNIIPTTATNPHLLLFLEAHAEIGRRPSLFYLILIPTLLLQQQSSIVKQIQILL